VEHTLSIAAGRSGRSRRRRLALTTLALIATFALVVIVAGHGAGPLGYLMVFGWGAWTAAVLLAWVAVALLASGSLVAVGSWRVGAGLLRLGGLASVASWVVFVRGSELLPFTLATSLPYFACLVALARQLRPAAPEGGASPGRAAPPGGANKPAD